MKVSSIIIEKYNMLCLHYNIIADSCYKKRKSMTQALSDEYIKYVIAALIVFDMQRQMSKGLETKYDMNTTGFANALRQSLNLIKNELISLELYSICDIDLDKEKNTIEKIYNQINDDIKAAMTNNNKSKNFDVGVTKILHFLHPDLFPIIDSNAANILKKYFGINYKTGTHGYSAEKYIKSMKKIQNYINEINCESFKRLEKGTPLTRIFDKITFITNMNEKKKKQQNDMT